MFADPVTSPKGVFERGARSQEPGARENPSSLSSYSVSFSGSWLLAPGSLAGTAIADQLDPFGIYGDALRFGVLFALMGSALVVFLYLWKNGRLDMDEEPKQLMMEIDDHGDRTDHNAPE